MQEGRVQGSLLILTASINMLMLSHSRPTAAVQSFSAESEHKESFHSRNFTGAVKKIYIAKALVRL